MELLPSETWAPLTPLPCWLQFWLLPWPWWLWGATGEETTAVAWGHTHHKHIKFLLMYVRGPVNTCWLGVLLVLQGALLGQEAPTSFWSCGYPHMPPPTTQIQTWVLITLHNQSMYTYNMRLPTNLPANHPHDDPKSQSILVCWPFLGFSVLFQNAPPTISCAPIPFGG